MEWKRPTNVATMELFSKCIAFFKETSCDISWCYVRLHRFVRCIYSTVLSSGLLCSSRGWLQRTSRCHGDLFLKCQTGLTVSSLKITCMSLFIYVAVLRQSWLLLLCFLEQSCSISLHAHQCLPAWLLQARDSVTGAASADFLGKVQCTHRWCLLVVQNHVKDDVETIRSKHYSRGLIWYVLDF